MVIYSEACNRVIDITLEFQTKPLLEMQEALEAQESEEDSESKEKANSSGGSYIRDSVELELSNSVDLSQESSELINNSEISENEVEIIKDSKKPESLKSESLGIFSMAV